MTTITIDQFKMALAMTAIGVMKKNNKYAEFRKYHARNNVNKSISLFYGRISTLYYEDVPYEVMARKYVSIYSEIVNSFFWNGSSNFSKLHRSVKGAVLHLADELIKDYDIEYYSENDMKQLKEYINSKRQEFTKLGI